jgi:O-antigen ligase
MQWSLQSRYVAAASLFLATGIAALVVDEMILIAIPFLLLLLPVVFSIIIHRTYLIFYTLIALLPLSTEINFTPSLGLDFPDEFLMMLLTGLFLVKLIYQPSLLSKRFIEHPLILLLALHLIWIIVSTIFSTDPLLSLKFLLAKTWFIIPFVVLPYFFVQDKKSFRLIAILLLVPIGFVVVQALFRHVFYQFSFEAVKEIYAPFFRNHVNFSAMLVCMLAILFTMFKLTPAGKTKRLLYTFLIFGIIAIILAYSRGAWLALIAGVIAYWLIKKKVIGIFISGAIIVVLIPSTWLINDKKYLQFSHDYNTTIFHENFREHLQATVQLKDVSNAERFYRWIAAINMIAEKPLTGFGPNTFYSHYKSYTERPFKTWVSNNPEHSSVHNYFLLISLEQGLPGLVFFCLLYIAMILYSQKLYHSISDNFYKQIALTTGVVLVMIGALIFASDLIETDKIGSIFWLCLGVLIVLNGKRKEVCTPF